MFPLIATAVTYEDLHGLGTSENGDRWEQVITLFSSFSIEILIKWTNIRDGPSSGRSLLNEMMHFLSAVAQQAVRYESPIPDTR